MNEEILTHEEIQELAKVEYIVSPVNPEELKNERYFLCSSECRICTPY
jgi:hypothetical protein